MLAGLGAEEAEEAEETEEAGRLTEHRPEPHPSSEQQRSSEPPQCEPPRLHLPDMSSDMSSDLSHCTAHKNEST